MTDLCARNHDDWVVDGTGRRCRTCKRLANARREKQRTAARAFGSDGTGGRWTARDTDLPETPTYTQIMKWRGYVA